MKTLQILSSPYLNWVLRGSLAAVLLAAMTVSVGAVDGPSGERAAQKKRSDEIARGPRLDKEGKSDPAEWIRRAKQAAGKMEEKIADERSIVFDLINRVVASSLRGEEARKQAMMFEPLPRINALLGIASVEARAQDREEMAKTLKLIRQELTALKGRDPESYRAEAASLMRQLVGIQCNLGDTKGALKSIDLITSDVDKSSLHFTDAGSITVPAGSYRANALADIAANQARLGEAAEARKTALSIAIREVQDVAIWLVVDMLAREGHARESQKLVDEFKATRLRDATAFLFGNGEPLQVPVMGLASRALVSLAKAQAARGEDAAADAILKSLPGEQYRQAAMRDVVIAQCEAGQFAAAKVRVRRITAKAARERALWEVGMEQARQGDFAGATKTAEAIGPASPRAILYCTIGEGLSKAGKNVEADRVLEKGKVLAGKAEPATLVGILARIGSVYSQAGREEEGRRAFERALEVSGKIKDEDLHQRALHEIADQQVRGGDYEGAGQTLAQVKDPSLVVWMLRVAGVKQHEAGRYEEARDTFRKAVQAAVLIDRLLWIEHPRSKAAALRGLGSEMAKLGELELVAQLAGEVEADHSRAPAYLFLGAAEGLIEARE